MKKKPAAGPPAWIDLAKEISNANDTDIVLFSGGIRLDSDDAFSEVVRENKSRKNITLVLRTFGGSVHSAYKIARCIQRNYSAEGKFTLLLSGVCKSAGTLIALGADEIIMCDDAELGPVDVQYSRHDEVGELQSTLTPTHAFEVLKTQSFYLFQEHFEQLRGEIRFPTKLAANIAAQLAVGLFKPIYAQLDPMRVGEISRSMTLTRHYGMRIAANTDNVKSGTIEKLLIAYPSHGCVIDREEAVKLFFEVQKPSEQQLQLCAQLSELDRKGYDLELQDGPPIIEWISQPIENGDEAGINTNEVSNEPTSKEPGENAEA